MGGLFGGNKPISTTVDPIAGVTFQTSVYGLPIPIVYGVNKIAGNIIWYGDFNAIAKTTTTNSGGKGGGGTETSNTTYTYQAAIMIGLCEGPITGFGNIWSTDDVTNYVDLGLTIFNGAHGQARWGYLDTYHADQSIGYSDTAYVCNSSYALDGNANIPQRTFEVYGFKAYSPSTGIYDANPADVIVDLLTAAYYGAGFDSAKIDALSQYATYCVANGFFFSPVIQDQKAASDYITELLAATNSQGVWSEGKLKIMPYGDEPVTGNGVTFAPNITPIYDLTDDDFQGDGEDPVRCYRNSSADAYNQMQIEFLDRSNKYAPTTAEAKDQAMIDLYGLRPASAQTMHFICDETKASVVVQQLLQRQLYIRNTYTFTLGWRYCLLEPMDLVTLLDAQLGMNKAPVRILEIEEDEDGLLTVKAEEYPANVSTAARYTRQAALGYSNNYNVSPGNVNAPVIFEAPDTLTAGTGLEIWIAASGGAVWGGCEVWVSTDNATYKKAGTVYGSARQGLLSAGLASGSDPDSANTLSVDLTVSRGALASGTKNDADARRTLCYVDGELLAYQTATLTASYKYNLTYLRRGAYNTTIGAHNSGSQFARLDDAIFKYPFTSDMIKKPVYLKFLSFNIYGAAPQSLADVQAYTYTIQGTALSSPLPDVQNLTDYYSDGQTMLSWDPVTDFRSVDYEVRKGTSWLTAQVLGRTANLYFTTDGDGTYWVAAHSTLAYSANPVSVVIAGATLVKNVIATYDEQATGWSGTLSGAAIVDGTDIILAGVGTFSAIPLMSAEGTIKYYGGISLSGAYEIPSAHVVDIGTAQVCNISASYIFRADNPYALFSLIPLVSAMASIDGNYAGLADVTLQINIAQNDGVFTGWRSFFAGDYVGRKFKLRANLTSMDANIEAYLSGMSFTVDVPDRIDKGTNVACSAGGLAVTYTTPFHVMPNVQITILSASQNDDAVLTTQTVNGFTVQILNGGVGVARNINWLSQGY